MFVLLLLHHVSTAMGHHWAKKLFKNTHKVL